MKTVILMTVLVAFVVAEVKNPKGYVTSDQDFNKNVKGASSPPESLTYVPKMSPVKNQGSSCDAFHAFTVTALYEYQSIKNNTKKIYSDQNLIDCIPDSGGCTGDDPYVSLEYVHDQGISDGATYKYVGKTQKCQRTASKNPAIFQDKNKICVGEVLGDEVSLKAILANSGPLIVYMTISGTTFKKYKNGIWSDKKCTDDPDMVDFVTLLVGYGSENKQDFWIIRNSYGTAWGEKGYMRVKRGSNMCGIGNYVLTVC